MQKNTQEHFKNSKVQMLLKERGDDIIVCTSVCMCVFLTKKKYKKTHNCSPDHFFFSIYCPYDANVLQKNTYKKSLERIELRVLEIEWKTGQRF